MNENIRKRKKIVEAFVPSRLIYETQVCLPNQKETNQNPRANETTRTMLEHNSVQDDTRRVAKGKLEVGPDETSYTH